MDVQLGIRQVLLAALLVMVVLVHAGFDSASAAGNKRPDFGSKAGFKLECELLGGTFSEDGLGNTNCHYPDGTWTQCDANGNDCWITPPRTRPPADPLDFDSGTLGEVTTDIGGTSAEAPETAGQSVKAAAHDQKDAKARHGKGKNAKGKKRKK